MSAESTALKEFLKTASIHTSTGVTQPEPVSPTSTNDSAVLKNFLQTAAKPSAQAAISAKDENGDPAASRAALSSFLGTQLGSRPVQPSAPPAVAQPKPQVAANHAPAQPVHAPAAAHTSPTTTHSASAAAPSATAVQTLTPPAAPAPAAAPTPAAAPVATAAPSQPAPQAAIKGKAFAWPKHIYSIENAIRIADFHFAETLISILLDVAEMTNDLSMKARLTSQLATIKIEHRQIEAAEAMIANMLRSLDGTDAKQSVGAAYCMHALAKCYHAQGKKQDAEKAQGMAIFTAQQIIGPCDPEMDAFRKPL